MRLLDTGTLLGRVIPDKILDFAFSHPESGTIAGIENRNKILRAEQKPVYEDPNIGDRPDWYRDAVFAQQQFTGVNPTTIVIASSDWIEKFKKAAESQGNEKMFALLKTASTDSLYIQDCSYFRAAVDAAADAALMSDDGTRFGCATVSLFQLTPDGKLHPLAIVIDYKSSIDTSVVIFNRRLNPSDPVDSEQTDWPWRYAKMCAQIADWTRHELTVHLVNTHFVEEAIIVATHRSFRPDHLVFRLLEPHWAKTLSLNAAARAALVPQVVVKIAGFTEDQIYAFINDAYNRFDWTSEYVPNNLEARGFPISSLDTEKFHNYVFGKNMSSMWHVLHTFVSSVVATQYTANEQVEKDLAIGAWTTEMRSASGGNMSSFPVIQTIDSLVDAIVMCIHIASPQHTAINYLQQYYQSFVINKPPSLCSPPPTSLENLLNFNESDVLKALPVDRPREWLLASHVPYLLSSKVDEDQTLVNYAVSQAKIAALNGETAIATAAATLYAQLMELVEEFDRNSKGMDDQTVPYNVMHPTATAVSILL